MNLAPRLVLLLASPALLANDIAIHGERCDPDIQLIARSAPLSEVLKAMADQLGFTVSFAASRDPLLEINRKADAETVLREVAAGQNFLAIHRYDERCQRKVITEVRVLAAGDAVARFEYVPGAGAGAGMADALPEEKQQALPQGTRRTLDDAEWQEMKRDLAAGKLEYDPATGDIKPVRVDDNKENK